MTEHGERCPGDRPPHLLAGQPGLALPALSRPTHQITATHPGKRPDCGIADPPALNEMRRPTGAGCRPSVERAGMPQLGISHALIMAT